MRHRRQALFLALSLLVQLVLTGPVLAAEDTYFEQESIQEDPEHPMAMGYGEASAEQLTDLPSSYSEVTTRALKQGEVLRKGIDVSSWQGTIDWSAVKKSGVEFAIIRAGYKGWGSGLLNDDSEMAKNIEGALKNGIQVGLYVYSQATTVAEAKEEAQYLINRAKGYKITLPLVIDYEYASSNGSYAGILWEANLSKEQATEVCNAFCDEVKKAGYTGMVYANKYMLEQHLIPSKLSKVWLAHYTYKTDYTGDYDFWQFSSNGEIAGISGRTDVNFWFDDSDALPFTDVKKTDWSYSSILFVYQEGIIKGVTATKFAPLENTKRCDLAVMLYRMAGSPAASGSNPFTDLKQDYYKDAVTWAYQEGFITGATATTFEPNHNITREQLVTILYRMAGKPEASASLSGFSDSAKVSAYAKDALAWGVAANILQGSDGKIDPKGSASRQQVAAFLTRYILNSYQ